MIQAFFQETTKFAKACAKKGGFFKCCVTVFTLNIFETARNRLIQEKLSIYSICLAILNTIGIQPIYFILLVDPHSFQGKVWQMSITLYFLKFNSNVEQEGLIRDKPRRFCRPGDKKDPCIIVGKVTFCWDKNSLEYFLFLPEYIFLMLKVEAELISKV